MPFKYIRISKSGRKANLTKFTYFRVILPYSIIWRNSLMSKNSDMCKSVLRIFSHAYKYVTWNKYTNTTWHTWPEHSLLNVMGLYLWINRKFDQHIEPSLFVFHNFSSRIVTTLGPKDTSGVQLILHVFLYVYLFGRSHRFLKIKRPRPIIARITCSRSQRMKIPWVSV